MKIIMKITDLNLLEIDVYKGEELIYSGECENIPDDLKEANVEVIKMNGKKLELKLI